MRIRADFRERVVVRPDDVPWVASPMPGVERRMLDRIGDEVARATSIVRYAPGSRFSEHVHGGGEEFLVLEGIFSDEAGDHGPGTYVRNPIGTKHAPWSEPGCTIFVKLHQFASGDREQKVVRMTDARFEPVASCPGVTEQRLHRFAHERVSWLRLDPGARWGRHDHPGGEEILVLAGSLEDECGSYDAGTWIRSPEGSVHEPASAEGCLLWVKTGHLPHPEAAPGETS